MRLEQFCIDQNRQGKWTSTSGHTAADIIGNKYKGYTLEGEAVNGEFVEETIAGQAKLIRESITKKLSKSWNWGGRNNWLCVTVPGYERPVAPNDHVGQTRYAGLFEVMLQGVSTDFRNDMLSHDVTMLWFVSFDSWLSFHKVLP